MHLSDSISAHRNLAALVDFSNLINSSLELDFALNNILLTCFGKFHTTKGIIALNDEDGILQIKASKGVSPKVLETFPVCKSGEYKDNTSFLNFLEQNDFPVCREIVSSDIVLGVLILGKRLVKKEYSEEDIDFLTTILNIGATAIENSRAVEKLKSVNRELDEKVNRLSSLFDLGKEFSGILEPDMIGKLLVYSIIGQLMVAKYTVLTCGGKDFEILENKFPIEPLLKALKSCDRSQYSKVFSENEVKENFPELSAIDVKLIIPMQIKSETKGLILLGNRMTRQAFTRSDIEYISSVGSLAIISIENAMLFREAIEKQKLEKDLELARNIQKNLLPKNIPQMKSFDLMAFNMSARQVGGDYYDIVKLDDERTLFAIGDVSGKGVPAALMMANVQAFLKSICKQKMPLDEATNLMNDLVSENTTMGSFITFFWGILNETTKEMIYVNAGHNPPLLVRNGEIIKLKTGGMILGVIATMVPYKSEKVQLQTGDALILFTDGISEAMNPDGEEFTDERLEALSQDIYTESSEKILEKITGEVKLFTQDAEQSDDITSLIIKVK